MKNSVPFWGSFQIFFSNYPCEVSQPFFEVIRLNPWRVCKRGGHAHQRHRLPSARAGGQDDVNSSRIQDTIQIIIVVVPLLPGRRPAPTRADAALPSRSSSPIPHLSDTSGCFAAWLASKLALLTGRLTAGCLAVCFY